MLGTVHMGYLLKRNHDISYAFIKKWLNRSINRGMAMSKKVYLEKEREQVGKKAVRGIGNAVHFPSIWPLWLTAANSSVSCKRYAVSFINRIVFRRVKKFLLKLIF